MSDKIYNCHKCNTKLIDLQSMEDISIGWCKNCMEWMVVVKDKEISVTTYYEFEESLNKSMSEITGSFSLMNTTARVEVLSNCGISHNVEELDDDIVIILEEALSSLEKKIKSDMLKQYKENASYNYKEVNSIDQTGEPEPYRIIKPKSEIIGHIDESK